MDRFNGIAYWINSSARRAAGCGDAPQVVVADEHDRVAVYCRLAQEPWWVMESIRRKFRGDILEGRRVAPGFRATKRRGGRWSQKSLASVLPKSEMGAQSSAPQLMRDDAKTMESFMLRTFVLSSLVVGVGFAGIALAQQGAPAQPTSNIKRTMLQKVDVPGTDYETMTGIAEIVPNASIGRHTHPGPETGYVIEGEMTLIVDGQPAKTVKAGESYQVPPGGIHDAKSGDKGVKVMAVYVVEKGKPLASPAP